MALENMHKTLEEDLKKAGAGDQATADWNVDWKEAQRHPGKPLPCPHCFVRGEVGRLKPLSNVGNTACAQCEVCRTEFRRTDAKP